MMRTRLGIIVAGFFCISTAACAAPVPRYGVSFSYPVVPKDPTHVHADRLSFWYQPPSLVWSRTRIYFDASVGYWWVTNYACHRSLMIYAIAPILRYYFSIGENFSPFINLSIGASYVSRTKLDDRNLGVHFAFQDQVGFGATIGKSQQLSITLTTMHYSNASMGAWNAGITVPVMLGVDFGFS